MEEDLDIDFRRTGGTPGTPELHSTFRRWELSAEDDRAWLGTERPGLASATNDPHGFVYEITFRRGGERRYVKIVEADLTQHLRPLVGELQRLASRR